MAKLAALPTAAQALPGRAQPIPTAVHFVNGHALKPPFPAGLEEAVFGLGCFWGAERKKHEGGLWACVLLVGARARKEGRDAVSRAEKSSLRLFPGARRERHRVPRPICAGSEAGGVSLPVAELSPCSVLVRIGTHGAG